VIAHDGFLYVISFALLAVSIFIGIVALVANFIWSKRYAHLDLTKIVSKTKYDIIVLVVVVVFVILKNIFEKQLFHNASSGYGNVAVIAVLWYLYTFAQYLILKRKLLVPFFMTIPLVILILVLSFVGNVLLNTKGSEVKKASKKAVRSLKSLGYVDWAPSGEDVDITKAGVVYDNASTTFAGMNLYNSRTEPEVYLMDMAGEIKHKWNYAFPGKNVWRCSELTPEDDLLVVLIDQRLIRLDWESKLLWETKLRCHHDVSIDGQGNVFTIARKDDLVFWHGIPLPILNDSIVSLDANGKIKKTVYLYDLVSEYITFDQVKFVYKNMMKSELLVDICLRKMKQAFAFEHGHVFDLLHTNNIEIAQRNVEGVCKKGDLLVSIREIDLVMFLDFEKESISWRWGPNSVEGQHHPTLLHNGNIMIFDNGVKRKYTRIIEVEPKSGNIVWDYQADPTAAFYSKRRGTAQRLANGNTLITESDKGRVFEITPEGKITWEFLNPDVNVENKERGTIYRMRRFFRDFDF